MKNLIAEYYPLYGFTVSFSCCEAAFFKDRGDVGAAASTLVLLTFVGRKSDLYGMICGSESRRLKYLITDAKELALRTGSLGASQ
ncbi:hypothetical protein CEXT_708231 [Caerostris extrusa]|uniref:Uncharacterized protein n=1 Tax=Caerostris extrusa TaxID=172846 RepID=A0AAV4Q955_CAEEX|nr:hypothetical protein CEXT_708231 [Caerostris extrusa]